MPRRRRVKEIQRRAARAAKHPDLRGHQVQPVGIIVQTETAWAEYDRYVASARHDDCCQDCG